ncbi:glyoxalase-like domain-containing protein [Purpureocillium lilacinum]|uniref:Glyoxalase-like domain-containing protein n=1 Tax=Purpureocillium lilacinum TaxID=33203 RepID=A0A179H4G4_PURLI|nr:glyoxalase-like domain-containing protein [Purpureocillium lilacinum]OAQ84912.1 glyoxalase-like domain-containing protein [Purpureocillium lilacinum]OAQ89462.1 glyoxalase-like domain-containing protein [Purpureocillium lilacinum]
MSGPAGPRPTLDHIVILVSHQTLQTIPDRLQDVLVVAPGGAHADGLTSNKLILLADGVYIEFIAFFDDVDPERRRRHRWGNLKENNIVDWAYTLPHEGGFGAVQQRVADAQAGYTYDDPVYDAVHNASSSVSVYGIERYWHFGVPSESTEGKHVILLSGTDGASGIRLALQGDGRGRISLELLPGLLLEVE